MKQCNQLDVKHHLYQYSRLIDRILHWPRNIKRRIKFNQQRKHQGFCDGDTWDLQSYYCKLFEASLMRFAEINHGVPETYMINVDIDDEDAIDEASKKYRSDILQAAEHFRKADEWNTENTDMTRDELNMHWEAGLKFLSEHGKDLWW